MFLSDTRQIVVDRAAQAQDLAASLAPPAPGRPGFDATRALDIVFSLLAIIFFAPIMALIWMAIRLQDGGPALFRQKRIGFGGQDFACLKFRTMVVGAEEKLKALLEADPSARLEWARDQKLRNDPRITWLGAFLRKSSLDELPQLFNVLRGEMSLVGPRPIIFAEVTRYGRSFRHYCAVRPGVTGIWQISGRNDVSYSRRVAMDITYARRRCVGLYMRILMATVPAVILRNGSY